MGSAERSLAVDYECQLGYVRRGMEPLQHIRLGRLRSEVGLMQGDWPAWADGAAAVVLLGLAIVAAIIFAKKSK